MTFTNLNLFFKQCQYIIKNAEIFDSLIYLKKIKLLLVKNCNLNYKKPPNTYYAFDINRSVSFCEPFSLYGQKCAENNQCAGSLVCNTVLASGQTRKFEFYILWFDTYEKIK